MWPFLIFQAENNSDHDSEGSLNQGRVREILGKHMVMIETYVNVAALRSSLVQCECITMEEVQEFHGHLPKGDAILKLVGIIARRGVTAFRGFIDALETSVIAEPGLRGHREVADTLKEAARSRALRTAPASARKISVSQSCVYS